jgi:formate dehydrogenase
MAKVLRVLCPGRLRGTTLPVQARYAAGTREILELSLAGESIRQEYLIVDGGKLAGPGAASYSVSSTTSPDSSGK